MLLDGLKGASLPSSPGLGLGSAFSGGDKRCALFAVPAEEWQMRRVARAFPVPPPGRVIIFLLLS